MAHYLQRLCLRSGGLLKPRPVHVGKRNIKTKLYTLMSRHHCANILLAPVPFFLSFVNCPPSLLSLCTPNLLCETQLAGGGNRYTKLSVYSNLLPLCPRGARRGTLVKALDVCWLCAALACVPLRWLHCRVNLNSLFYFFFLSLNI